MHIHHLPQDIFPHSTHDNAAEKIIFHDYKALTGSFKGKSILHKNAISMVITGEKTMHFAEKTVVVKDDEFHFLSSGNCLASMDLSDRFEFHSILIFFDNSVLTDFYIKYHNKIEQHKHIKQGSEPYISFKKDAFVCNYITSLELQLNSGTTLSEEMRLLKWEELMLHLLEQYPQTLLSFQFDKHRGTTDLQLRRVVENNVTNNLTIEELAFLCNTSLSTFKRRFTGIYGTSPTKWMVHQKMLAARDMLVHANEKPGDVYYKVGYENHSSFSQAFKQAFGVSPKDFQSRSLNVQQ